MVTRLPLVDRDETVGVIAIFRDVTEQVRARIKIDEEVRRRDQFLAMLSHELRNPLGAVVTATAMLKHAEAARHTMDHSGGGLGVGLTLVRALVELHGGTVSAHSDGDGAGSELTVRLPTTVPAEPALAEGGPPHAVALPGARVVVVEDNADSREMLLAMLSQAGLVCHAAPDGVAGLRLIDEVSPDVVILDVGLPAMDGLEVARRIRGNPRHAGVRLIALTGQGGEACPHHCPERFSMEALDNGEIIASFPARRVGLAPGWCSHGEGALLGAAAARNNAIFSRKPAPP